MSLPEAIEILETHIYKPVLSDVTDNHIELAAAIETVLIPLRKAKTRTLIVDSPIAIDYLDVIHEGENVIVSDSDKPDCVILHYNGDTFQVNNCHFKNK